MKEEQTKSKKTYLIVFLLIGVVVLLVGMKVIKNQTLKNSDQGDAQETVVNETVAHESSSEELDDNPSATTPVPTIVLRDEDLASYAETYKRPDVLFLRKALDAFQQGTYDDDMILITAIEEQDLDGKPSGLNSFTDYLDSKFSVFQIVDNPFGGANILIIFVNKPNQIFTAWVYERSEGDFDLRGFWGDPPTDQVKFDEMIKRFKPLLEKDELLI